jgi:serpin B
VWTQQGYGIQQPYSRALASAFDTGIRETDFSGPENARQTINKPVEDQTDGQGSLRPEH